MHRIAERASTDPASRLRDVLYATAILVGTTGLFTVDISYPRGVVDGVGYAAVVALASRFGPRALIGTAAVTTALTLIASALVPDAGISVAGMWAKSGLRHRRHLDRRLDHAGPHGA